MEKREMEKRKKESEKEKELQKKYYFMYSYLYNGNHSFTDVIMEDGFFKTGGRSSGGSFYSN